MTATESVGVVPRTCYCGQLLMICAIKCPSRKDCHVENVQRALAEKEMTASEEQDAREMGVMPTDEDSIYLKIPTTEETEE